MSELFVRGQERLPAWGLERRLLAGILWLAVLIVLFPSPGQAMSRRPAVPPSESYVQGQILVKFHDNVPPERELQIIRAERGEVMKAIGAARIYLIRLPRRMSVPEAVEGYEKHPEVRYAEPNFKVKALEER